QATIRNIDEGDYGFCADTGEPIGLKRLLARPTATLSVEAQERRERMKKQFAD
ncbi:TraR/DksA C4-type zinc finger protein, partial [Shigella sonnei]|nr:TraR/DksA C4-type zinc finger protein [Shigella sonnei]